MARTKATPEEITQLKRMESAILVKDWGAAATACMNIQWGSPAFLGINLGAWWDVIMALDARQKANS